MRVQGVDRATFEGHTPVGRTRFARRASENARRQGLRFRDS